MANYLSLFQTIKNSCDHLVIAVEDVSDLWPTVKSGFEERLPFKEPYATIILVTCKDLDEFKTILKPRLKLLVQNDEKEWFIIFVSRVHPSNDQTSKMAKKVYVKLEVDFSSKKRERTRFCMKSLQTP